MLWHDTIGNRIQHQDTQQLSALTPLHLLVVKLTAQPGYSHDRTANIFATAEPNQRDSVLLPRLSTLDPRTSGPTRCGDPRDHPPVSESTVHAYVTPSYSCWRVVRPVTLVQCVATAVGLSHLGPKLHMILSQVHSSRRQSLRI